MTKQKRHYTPMFETFESRMLLSTVPTGFVDSELNGDLTSPTALDIAPDGRVFIAQQDGVIRILKNDQTLTTFANLSSQVDGSNERGMLGLTLDPNFATNHYVYVYYTAKSPTIHNRVARLVANGDVGTNETTIIDFPSIGDAIWHMGGAIHFGPDGKLYVAVGDHQQSAMSQSLTSVFGKILRINADGTIPSDNPFYNTTSGIYRSIWAYGFRNPFTFSFQPGTGLLYANDVGDTSWEEVDNVVKGGNYGWPGTEGYTTNSNYITPVFSYPHSVGYCITGAAFYSPAVSKFPSQYKGKFFFTDFSFGWMKVLDPATGQVTNFGTGFSFPTDAKVAPDGTLYFLQRGQNVGIPTSGSGSVHKLDYVLNTPPNVILQPKNQSGAVGQQVTFSVSATGSTPFTYQWRRNNVNIANTNSPTYTRTIAANDDNAVFTCYVTNAYGNDTSDGATLDVINGTPPSPTIDFPTASQKWSAGETINFSGSGTDLEDGTLGAGAFTWQVDYLTDGVSRPFMLATTGIAGGSFTVPSTSPYTGTNAVFRIILKATDSDGLSATVTRDITPNVATATFTTNIAGLSTYLDGSSHASPFSIAGVVGLERNLEAPAIQSIGGVTYQFVSWSDGGEAAHTINWPTGPTTYTANYSAIPVTYISDLTPTSSTNGWGPVEKDRSNGELAANDGVPLKLNGITYTKGLGIHANSDVRYNLAGGGYTEFRADIGLDDEVGSNGSVVFQVYVDNVLKYTSPTMTGDTGTQSIVVPVAGANALRLVVTDAGNGANYDHADWANAVLTKGSVPPPPPPPSGTTYLSDLNYTVVSNGWGTAEKDRSNGEQGATDGKTITLAGTPYTKGIGVHAASQITYNLNGQYTAFLSDIGIDDEVGNTGSVIFQVYVDNVLKYTSPTMTGASGTQQVNVNVTNGNVLRLMVTDAGNGNGSDHADWASARLTSGAVVVLPPPASFSAPTFTPTGSHAHGIVTGDFDGGGALDLAVANAGSNTVSVLLGNGNATFGTPTNYTVGAEPKSVFAKDLNGDTKLDLIVASQGSGTISVLLNNGNGTFADAVSYGAVSGAHEATSADVDGDLDNDIIVAGWGEPNVRVLLNNGNGTFNAGTLYAVGAAPHSVVAVDFTGDSKPDIAVADHDSNNVAFLKNNGNGTFAAAVFNAVGSNPHSIRAADLNGDTKMDLVTANDGSANVSVLLGNGNGTFAAAANFATGSVPKGVAIGDVNGDSKLDLITTNTAGNYPNSNNPGGNTLSVLLGNGNGTFGSPTAFTTGLTPFNAALGDYDGDGDLDIATANWHTDNIAILRNLLFQPVTNTPPTANADSATTQLNQPVIINVLGNDSDAGGSLNPSSVAITTQPAHGALSVNATTGAITYTPASNYSGADEFFYTVKDNLGATSSPAKVSITVNPAAPTTTYLGDINWASATNGWGAVEKNRSNGEQGAADGKTITLNGVTYAKGLGAHSASSITYNLGGAYSQFLSDIGIDDEVGNGGSVTFQVYVDNVLKYTSPTMTGASSTLPVSVSVAGASTLRLVINVATNGNDSDHGDWANARLTT